MRFSTTSARTIESCVSLGKTHDSIGRADFVEKRILNSVVFVYQGHDTHDAQKPHTSFAYTACLHSLASITLNTPIKGPMSTVGEVVMFPDLLAVGDFANLTTIVAVLPKKTFHDQRR